MARRDRQTVPLESKLGLLETYAEQEPHLIEAEWRGRRWAFEQAKAGRAFSDVAVLDLHAEMFSSLFEWAGQVRAGDHGPGGKVPVPHFRVREELRKFSDDFAAWVACLSEDPTVADLGGILADAHHRFQWIHPFTDTNGRTGRVVDHFILWSTFSLAGASIETSPSIEYFPDLAEETEYYDGLLDADLDRPERLRSYYVGRLQRALSPIFTVHYWDGVRTTTCVAIHEDLASAIADARVRSAADAVHLYRVLGERGRIVARARGGVLIDEFGNET